MKMRLATPALLMVGVLAFAACGGDDDDGGSLIGGKSPTTVKESAGASSDDTDATTADDDSTATDDSSDDTDATTADDDTAGDDTDTSYDFSGKGSGDFCKKLEKVAKDIDLNDSDSLDSGDFKKTFEAGQDALDEFADDAPAEIKGDFKTLKSFYAELEPILEKYDFDFSKIAAAAQTDPEALAALESAASDPKLTEATERIDAYATQVCGFSLDGE
jgi:hypothetical protein